MKKFLQRLIERKKQELKAKEEKMKNSQDIDEVRSLGENLIALRDEINEIEEQLKELEKDNNNDGNDNEEDEREEENNRSARNNDGANEGRSTNSFNPNAVFNILGTTQINQRGQVSNDEDVLSSMEYRTEFKHYAQTGERSSRLNEILTQYRSENRAAGEVTSDALGVLIPHTVLQELIQKIEKSYGQFSSRVRMLNVQGGVEIPISEFEATFTWGGTDGNDKEHGVSEEQDAGGAKGSVIFSYHIGEVRIAQSLLQSILSVEVFEKELVKALLKAYLKARDEAVLRGTGDGQPTGILTDVAAGLKRVPEDNIIEFTEEEIADWTTWEKKLFANIPIGMEGANPEFAMAKQTYIGNLCTLKDANNQPINKAGFDVNDKQYKFNEYPVLRTEQDLFKSFDLCANGEYFGIFWVPEEAYGINSNMTFGYKRYFDEDKNKWITKGLVILDGKPLNTNYIYLLKKSVKA